MDMVLQQGGSDMGGEAAAPVRPPFWVLAAALLLTALGLTAFSQALSGPVGLWHLLTTDGLRSIGLLLPPVSLWLALRAWSWSDWSRGSWWGLALMAAALVLAMLREVLIPYGLVQAGSAVLPFSMVPVGLLLCSYFSGAVLLFGGARAWRQAWFPLLLLLFINPVPRFLQNLVDLPLQTVAAQVTRGFAHWLQVPVEGAALKMMFSPALGIFIAPGCDGLRGAATMGYLALIIGYLRRMRPWRWTMFVTAAVTLAYLLNFVRLCGVIIYYWFALRIPAIGRFGTEIDYCIGAAVFFTAALFLLRAPRLRVLA
jgi:exosortase J